MTPQTPPNKPKDESNNNYNKPKNPTRPFHPRTPSQPKNQTTSHGRSNPSISNPTTPLQPTNNSQGLAYNFPPYQNPTSDHDSIVTDLETSVESPLAVHFSPSKARAHALQSQALSTLGEWLDELLSPSSSHVALSHTPSDTNIHDTAPSLYAAPRTTATATSSARLLSQRWQTEQRTQTMTNPDLASSTTRWLQEVLVMNRTADERRRLVFEAQRAEAEANDRRSFVVPRDDSRTVDDGERPSTLVDRLLSEIYDSLTAGGQKSLRALAETSVLLGHVPPVTSSRSLGRELGQAVMEHTLRSQEIQGQVENLQDLQGTLSKQLEQAKKELEAFDGERTAAVRDAEQMHPQTAQWIRETKQILMKIKEYQSRLAALERSRPGFGTGQAVNDKIVRVEDVVELQARVDQRKENVRRLEETVEALNGLPPDLEASRHEVRRAKAELEGLKTRREELFRTIAGR